MSKTPDELINENALQYALANPLLKTPDEQRAFLEGFLNGSHWSFNVVMASVSKWCTPPATQGSESDESDSITQP